MKQLARRNPARESGVSAWVPPNSEPKAKAKVWGQVVYAKGNPKEAEVRNTERGKEGKPGKGSIAKVTVMGHRSSDSNRMALNSVQNASQDYQDRRQEAPV